MKNKSLIISFVRIIACLIIFFQHFLVKIGVVFQREQFVIFGLIAFFAIAGFLCEVTYKKRNWLKKKIVRIYLLPHFLIFLPLLIINNFYTYKKITFSTGIIQLFGGTLFMKRTLYETLWFLNIILIFYFFVFLAKKMPKKFEFTTLFILLTTSYIFLFRFFYLSKPISYFITFILGYNAGISYKENRIKIVNKILDIYSEKKISKKIFNMSNYTYEFYLVHVIIIYLFSLYFTKQILLFLILSLIFSSFASVLLNKIFNKFIKITIKQKK